MKNPIKSLLEDDHESLGQLLTELDLELTRSSVVRAFELLDLFWARLAVHIRAENLHLFPALANAERSLFSGKRNLPTSTEAQNVLMRLRSDHDFFMKELAQMMKAGREIIAKQQRHREEVEALRKQLATIANRLEAHNLLEERLAYTWPTLLFEEKTVAALSKRLRHELENLPPRFAT
jgi:iron-sulfur cluster repair protein YtfE (RIC family)